LNEHFGIAVAELVRAGCITWVPDNGGQIEIVGAQPLLRYRTDDEAVEKICTVLASRDTQSELRAALSICATQFSEQTFMRRMTETITQFTARNGIN